jgi:hypothetical protein
MDTKAKSEITKYLSFPMLLIGSGSFVGVIGWLGLAQAAESILFFAGSALLSFSGSMATLCGLMSLERIAPSKLKVQKLKSEISKNIKIQYPTYIIKVENLKQKYQEFYGKLPEIRTDCENFRQDIRNQRSKLVNLQKQLQENLKDNAPVIDNDSVDGIAKKILWSEKEIQLTELNDALEKLSGFFTGADLERYRDELMHVSSGLTQLNQGIRDYRELMLVCNRPGSNYENITKAKQKVDKVDTLMILQEKRLEELGTEMDTKCEEAKMELSLFQQQLDDIQVDNE